MTITVPSILRPAFVDAVRSVRRTESPTRHCLRCGTDRSVGRPLAADAPGHAPGRGLSDAPTRPVADLPQGILEPRAGPLVHRLAIVLAMTLSACGGSITEPNPEPEPEPNPNPVYPSGALTRAPLGPIVRNGPEAFDGTKAGPRSVVLVAAGDYRMWYEAIESPGSDTRVAYALSQDGVAWIKQGVVMDFSEPWEMREVAPTAVLFDPSDNLWKMWYHGGGNASPRQIGYASSTDGLTWTKYAGNPVLSPGAAGSWEDGLVADVKVIRVGPGDFRMWYSGKDAASGAGQVGYATSPDGITWTKYAGNPVLALGPAGAWDGGSIDGPGIVRDGGLFHMWYPARPDPATSGARIGYACSSDGVRWFRVRSPVLEPSGDPADPINSMGDTIDAYWDGDRYRVIFGAFDFRTPPVLRGMGQAHIVATRGLTACSP